MTDLRWFLLCVFGFILVIAGFPVWRFSYVYYFNCLRNCVRSCTDDCSGSLIQSKIQYVVGIIIMVLGSVLVVCSCPIVTRRLAAKSRTNLTGAPTQANTESENLREQLNTQSAQLRTITERLGQMEKGQSLSRETETRPLGSEVINNY